MMPTAKNRGSTVLGVRMGLRSVRPLSYCTAHPGSGGVKGDTHCHALSRCCRKAVSVSRRVFR
jgi:hypothetical protein